MPTTDCTKLHIQKSLRTKMEHFTTEENEAIRKIFNQFDANNDGGICRTELFKLTLALNDPLSDADLADFMQSIDTDHSGNISFDEFIQYWGNN